MTFALADDALVRAARDALTEVRDVSQQVPTVEEDDGSAVQQSQEDRVRDRVPVERALCGQDQGGQVFEGTEGQELEAIAGGRAVRHLVEQLVGAGKVADGGAPAASSPCVGHVATEAAGAAAS